jgi:hypothetical protein
MVNREIDWTDHTLISNRRGENNETNFPLAQYRPRQNSEEGVYKYEHINKGLNVGDLTCAGILRDAALIQWSSGE